MVQYAEEKDNIGQCGSGCESPQQWCERYGFGLFGSNMSEDDELVVGYTQWHWVGVGDKV